ncbi:bacteriophage V tail protein [Escherichia coli M056]|uniref:baseplate J/gp47 family protein n=1 Tax=Escherichia coli TaxID=562 RepID=UPI000A184464|nr:baseplate J/gp47 family protein [Escherichia coli]OSK27552.1 bacteriophage V tail protein [Escherichia coli M056]
MADSQFARPELPRLIATIRRDLLTRFEQDAVLRRMDAEVYARVQAAAVHTLYGYLDYLARNMLPDMCDEDWLYRHAQIKRCPRKTAVAAKGFVRWEGVSGTLTLPAGTQLLRDDLVTFTTTQSATASGGLLRVPVVADDAGSAGNTDDGTALRLGTPVTGLSSTGYADSLNGGADAEELEVWRARVLERYYWIPQGGADSDYIIWAKEISGVTRAWTFRHYQGIGTVGVMVATSDPTKPAPGEETVQAVREHILPLAPVAGGGLFVFAATEKIIPLTIALSKDTEEIRTAVIAELNALMLRDGQPSGRIYHSRISEAISLAAGEVAHQLRSPEGDVVLGKTELPVLGAITWTTYAEEAAS